MTRPRDAWVLLAVLLCACRESTAPKSRFALDFSCNPSTARVGSNTGIFFRYTVHNASATDTAEIYETDFRLGPWLSTAWRPNDHPRIPPGGAWTDTTEALYIQPEWPARMLETGITVKGIGFTLQGVDTVSLLP